MTIAIEIQTGFRTHDIDWNISIVGTSIAVRIDQQTDSFDLSGSAEGENYLDDALTIPYNPITRITRTGETVEVVVFYDDYYKEPGFICPFKKESNSVLPVPTKDNDLALAKSDAVERISKSFNDNLGNGFFDSTVLGIKVDCRRSGTKNDLQNVQGLISYMQRNSVDMTNYVGYNTIRAGVTVLDLSSLVNEMTDYALSLYQKKWNLLAQIDIATTIQGVKEVVW